MDPLAAHVRAAATGGGARLCLLFVADWVVASTGRDPAASHRDSGEIDRISGLDAEGFAALAVEAMASAGFGETSAPIRGDVGLVLAGAQPLGAIRLGRRWVALTVAGIAMADWPMIRAWKVAT